VEYGYLNAAGDEEDLDVEKDKGNGVRLRGVTVSLSATRLHRDVLSRSHPRFVRRLPLETAFQE
jgi:hypothetical protein